MKPTGYPLVDPETYTGIITELQDNRLNEGSLKGLLVSLLLDYYTIFSHR